MSAPRKLLQLMSDGQPWTPQRLAEESGLELWRVYNALRVLRAGSFMRSLPQPYEITPEGLSDLAQREEKAGRNAPEPDAAQIVATAIQRRPAIQAAWSVG